MNKFVGKLTIAEVLVWVFLSLVLLFTILPIVFMFVASFMDAKQILAMPFDWIPSKKYFTTDSRTFFTNFIKAIMGNNNEPYFLEI